MTANERMIFQSEAPMDEIKAHQGKEVIVLRQLNHDEVDHEVGNMYRVTLVEDESVIFDVFADELIFPDSVGIKVEYHGAGEITLSLKNKRVVLTAESAREVAEELNSAAESADAWYQK